MTQSIDDILAVAENPDYVRVVTAKIAFVPQALRDEHAELDARLTGLDKARDTVDIPDDHIAVRDRILEIEAEIEAASVEFRFRGIGYRAWADLLRKHPPTREQLTADRRLDHNPDTFPYEAIAASCAAPPMTAEQVRRLEAAPTIDAASWMALWDACLRANVADAAPKSRAAGLIAHLSGGSGKRPTSSASPAASSSVA